MLQGGRVVDDSADEQSVAAIGVFNDRIAADRQVKVVLMALGDGVSFVQMQ